MAKSFQMTESQFSRNERRTFETLSDLERSLKSSVKRFHRQTDVDKNVDNNVNKNVDNNVDKKVDDFYDDKNDSIVMEQERRRLKIKEVLKKLNFNFQFFLIRTRPRWHF